MKKTLLISYFFPPQIGGIENYYVNLCQRLTSHEIVVLTEYSQEADQFDKCQPYKIYRTNFFGGVTSPRWWPLRHEIKKIIKQEGIEQIIFGHFHPFNMLGVYFKLPYFVFVHGTDVKQAKYNLGQRIFFKLVYKYCHQIVANSLYIAQEVKAITKNSSKVTVIYPGINFKIFDQKIDNQLEKRGELNLSDNDLIILSIGRLVKQKNFHTIIKLMPDLLLDFPNLKYIIVGDGPEKNALMKLVYTLGLKNSVKFVGRIDNNDASKLTYYQMADLFVSVSAVAEGFGIAYLEAQASGLPVVASNIGGSCEAVVHNETGLLVDPHDLGQIKEAIVDLLNNKQKRHDFGQRAKKRVADKFNWSNQINKLKEIL